MVRGEYSPLTVAMRATGVPTTRPIFVRGSDLIVVPQWTLSVRGGLYQRRDAYVARGRYHTLIGLCDTRHHR